MRFEIDLTNAYKKIHARTLAKTANHAKTIAAQGVNPLAGYANSANGSQEASLSEISITKQVKELLDDIRKLAAISSKTPVPQGISRISTHMLTPKPSQDKGFSKLAELAGGTQPAADKEWKPLTERQCKALIRRYPDGSELWLKFAEWIGKQVYDHDAPAEYCLASQEALEREWGASYCPTLK